jgi:hypothetical protein
VLESKVVEHAGLSLYSVDQLAVFGQLTYNTVLVGWMGYDDFFYMGLIYQPADCVILLP